MANEPRAGEFFRGVASVPRRSRSAFGDTGDIPVAAPLPPTLTDAPPPARRARTYPERGRGPQRPRQAPQPRGMIVRRRWRRLRSGAGWTWTGLSFLLVCWLIWAVSVRGGDPIGPLLALVMVLVFAAFMFVVARLLGRAVLEQTLGRERPSAWPSHLTVCVFVTLAGLAFLQQTQWIQDSWRWLSDSRQSLLDLWPL